MYVCTLYAGLITLLGFDVGPEMVHVPQGYMWHELVFCHFHFGEIAVVW